MSLPFKLYRLQQVDSHLDRIRNRLKEIERLLQDNLAIQKGRELVKEKDERLLDFKKELRRAEIMVQDQREKIKKVDNILYSGRVRNPKELQDHQNEAEALKRYLQVLEDRQLEAMIALDEADEEAIKAHNVLSTAQNQYNQQNKVLSKEKVDLIKEISQLEEERQPTALSISKIDINRYDLVREQRGGVAVAKVTEKSCDACGSTLSASLLHSARDATETTICSSCGRILYAG